MSFTHLHVHTQYSILDGAAPISEIVKKAKNDGMSAVAITDHGAMYGVKEFHQTCKKQGIKPLLGCEAYMVDDLSQEKDRSNYHIILIAKNKTGYGNLLKMVTMANVDGFYYKPRIDRKILREHSEGIIVTSACLGGEIPRLIQRGNIEEAERRILWFKEIFGGDFYLEMQRHPNNNPWDDVWGNQQLVGKHLLELSEKLEVKIVASNDTHFVNEQDAIAHDLLVCISTGKDIDAPNRMKYTRQEWFKTTAEMKALFSDIPEAVNNTQEVADKVEEYELDAAPIMPEFPIPESFGTMQEYKARFDASLVAEFKFSEEETDEKVIERLGSFDKMLRVKFEADYLEFLSYNGAKKHYGDKLNKEIDERLRFELDTIKKMGFPGYFLIVQDFIAEARKMGILVGPGRGSAAGSVVAYCLEITTIDPMKYDLLFERFLNPDRISMPDIDIDFDDDGRSLILDWVAQKYGKDKVAHICTFGTMAAKSSIKDVARVLKLPLDETNAVTKRFPENKKLRNVYRLLTEHEGKSKNLDKALEYWRTFFKTNKAINEKKYPEIEVFSFLAKELSDARAKQDRTKEETLKQACALEGSVRQSGVHACGVLIGKDPLVEHIPLITTKDEDLLSTQYDGRFVEDIGLLKMDFLGLKTLSIIKETLINIKHSKGVDVDIDHIPFDDKKTFNLFCKGDTTAIFQFESPGMKKHLKSLMPNRFEDLVAMNALYRPGPMEYIGDYIARKHGRKNVVYDHPMMEKYLRETYGITVFQEQVMLLSRHLGQLTRGESDSLRKAMGKKKLEEMAKLKVKFLAGCLANPDFMEGYETGADKQKYTKAEDLAEKIWGDWEAFASYAFNKSHSVCYADLAYRTAYLKAHHPAEFMAGVLSRNLGNADKIAFFMDECRQMGLNVKGPDVNESMSKFAVNEKGEIRFGMEAIKGTGSAAVVNIIEERKANGNYKDIYDFAERVNLTAVTKKTWESLAISGSFDSLSKYKRAEYFSKDSADDLSFISKLIKYGQQMKTDKEEMVNSLFPEMMAEATVKRPTPAPCEDWTVLHELKQERKLIGIYLSGHPLDQFKYQMEALFNVSIEELNHLDKLEGRIITTGGIITKVSEGLTKKAKPFGRVLVENHFNSYELAFFGDDWMKFKNLCREDLSVMIKGEVSRRDWGDHSLQFKVTSIDLLSTISDKHIKTLSIDVPLRSINGTLVDVLSEILNKAKKKRKGKQVRIRIFDEKNGERINLLSGTLLVDIENDLLKELSQIRLNGLENEPLCFALT